MPSNQFFIACIILVLALKCSVYNEILESICYCTYPPAFNSPVNCTISGNMVTVPKFSSTTVSESEFFTVIKVRLWGKRSTMLVSFIGHYWLFSQRNVELMVYKLLSFFHEWILHILMPNNDAMQVREILFSKETGSSKQINMSKTVPFVTLLLLR